MQNQRLFPFLIVLFFCACQPQKKVVVADAPSEVKAKLVDSDGWTILFDGSNADHWIELGKKKFPRNGWVIEDGALVLNKGGNIITREQYADFELEFEFNLTEGANSGIKYYVTELTDEETGKTVMNGPEYQIIDDVYNPDIQERKDETVTSAALYLFYEPQGKQLKPAGAWNTGKIISQDGLVEHWLNGVKVVSYKRGSPEFLELKADTKFRKYPEYGEAERGHIMLTDHKDKVYFRKIRVRQL